MWFARAEDLNFLDGGLVGLGSGSGSGWETGRVGARTMMRPPGSSSPFATAERYKGCDLRAKKEGKLNVSLYWRPFPK